MVQGDSSLVTTFSGIYFDLWGVGLQACTFQPISSFTPSCSIDAIQRTTRCIQINFKAKRQPLTPSSKMQKSFCVHNEANEFYQGKPGIYNDFVLATGHIQAY